MLVISGMHQALSGRQGWSCSIPMMSEGSCLCLSSVRHGDNAGFSHELAYSPVLLNHDYQRVVCFQSSKHLKYYNNAWHFSTSKQAANSN